ncbi:phosphoadenosine phosphosulfate reductase family protein [Staphylococcus hyicus]|uniref:phosphoadenosine phosphosulfate reductase domain-containing protein n=1 Tax=Staphylococcus hyicus TaxID=1284 RepID=UPI0036D2B560
MAGKEQRKFIDIDVYTMAKKRIKHIIHTFDTLIVAFSGGKDSLVTLELVDEVYKELGIKEKVKVIFRDEELIPDDVINFVKTYAESGRFDFRYYAIPLKSTKFILGETIDYVQWDKNRKWLRQPPEYAITLSDDDNRVFDQYTADEFVASKEKGRIAIINGIRADESLTRLMSCVVKKNENYINSSGIKRIKFCKPIYDWTEKDIFLYFYQKGITYCETYDKQMLNNQMLRVATPLHAENAKRIGKLRTLYPTYYEQLIDIFPEMLVQERYWNEYDRYGIIDKYEPTFDGIRQYIKENISGEQQLLALKRVKTTEITRKNKLKKGQGKHNYGGYPVLHVFKQVVNGNYKREIMPVSKMTNKDKEFEKQVLKDEV